jgi:hypothetical protein
MLFRFFQYLAQLDHRDPQVEMGKMESQDQKVQKESKVQKVLKAQQVKMD